AGWRPEASRRRRATASTLQRALEPRAVPLVVATIDYAARVLDIGKSLHVVNRHEHVDDIILHTDLQGFAHQELALVSAVVRRAGDRHSDILPLALARDAVSR